MLRLSGRHWQPAPQTLRLAMPMPPLKQAVSARFARSSRIAMLLRHGSYYNIEPVARYARFERKLTPLALQVEGESGIAYRRCLFYPLPTRGSAVSALRLGSVPHAAPLHAALPPLAAPRPSAPKGGALITTVHKLCADIRR